MDNTSVESPHRSSKRLWLGVTAGVFAVLALCGIFALELLVFGPRHTGPGYSAWLFWTAAIPAYLLLQFFSEAVLEGFLGARSLALKAIPVVPIALFYAAYFMFIV
jgi:hypothetical protein